MRHWPFLVVLLFAALLRAGVAIAYRPALFFSDSWSYLDLAYRHAVVGISPARPSGYPLILHALAIGGPDLLTVTVVQHLAGLAVGVLVYVLLLRLGMPRWVATAAAALVLLDSYAIVLEQHILSEAFFTIALVGSVFLVVGSERGRAALVASGALLAIAICIRTAGIFFVPAWLAYLVWTRRAWRPVGLALASLAAPLLLYAAAHQAAVGQFGMTGADGWFLYGRIGSIADCREAEIPRAGRPLCERTERDRREGAAFHVWSPESPAGQVFGGISHDEARQERSNEILRDFAVAIVRDRPLEVTQVVLADYLRYFRPGVASAAGSDIAITLPERPRTHIVDAQTRDRYVPDYAPAVHPPATVLRAYQAVGHTPRWLIGGLAVAGLVAVALRLVGRGRTAIPRAPEALLLVGGSLLMLLATTATSDFVVRYLIPLVPLIVCGGVVAVHDLAAAIGARVRTQSGTGAPVGRPRAA